MNIRREMLSSKWACTTGDRLSCYKHTYVTRMCMCVTVAFLATGSIELWQSSARLWNSKSHYHVLLEPGELPDS